MFIRVFWLATIDTCPVHLVPEFPSLWPFVDFSLLEESLTIPMLVDLMKKHNPSVQAACLGVMQNLSSVGTFHRQLLERGVLEALDSSKDVDGGTLSSQCAAVLYNFSLSEKSIAQMMELGGIFLITHLSYSNVVKVSKRPSLVLRSVLIPLSVT